MTKNIGMFYRIKTAEAIKEIMANGRNFPFGNNGKNVKTFQKICSNFVGKP